MKWFIMDWFGGSKVECQECHHFAVGDSNKLAISLMISHLIDYCCPYCITCNKEKESRLLTKDNNNTSFSKQLADKNAEVLKLNKTISFWKDAWFEQREATGKMYWEGRKFK